MNVKLETNFSIKYFLAPELQVSVSSQEKCHNFSKTSTPLKFHLSHIIFQTKLMFIMYNI